MFFFFLAKTDDEEIMKMATDASTATKPIDGATDATVMPHIHHEHPRLVTSPTENLALKRDDSSVAGDNNKRPQKAPQMMTLQPFASGKLFWFFQCNNARLAASNAVINDLIEANGTL